MKVINTYFVDLMYLLNCMQFLKWKKLSENKDTIILFSDSYIE
jgi:hypothetical protein